MKKALTVFMPIYFCLLLVVFLPSCSDSQDSLIETTTQALVTEETYKTSGIINETIKWKYDEQTSVFCFYGTGKMESKGMHTLDGNEQYWSKIAEKIRLEDGITDIGNFSFLLFNNAKSVYLPASYEGDLPEIENIEKYIVDENNPKYSSDENGVVFNKDKTEIIRYPKGSLAEIYEIPEGVTSICNGAFDGSRNLKTVVMPKSINSISGTTFEESSIYLNPENWEDDVFYVDDCLVKVDWGTKAENIIVKEGTRRIEAHAFARCENVKSITIPDSVEIIGAQAFESCSSLEKIYIGSGVEEIGGAPFMFDVEGTPCSNLKNIEVSKDKQMK